MKYLIWEKWFTISVVLFATILVTMTLPGSKNIVSLPYIFIIVILNLITSIYYGFKKPKI